MNKVFGVLAIIAAVVSFVIPFVGVFVAFAALACAAIAAFLGDKGLTIATLVLCAVKLAISPTFWALSGVLIFTGAGALRFANHRHV